MRTPFALVVLLMPALLQAQSFLDPTFGTGGYVTLDIDGSFDQFKDIAVQDDGGIVAVGHSNVSGTNALIARFTSDGVLDPTFNTTGWSLGPDQSWHYPGDYYGVALQADGKILCAGIARPLSTDPYNILVVRYLSDGSVDATFGTSGYVLLPPPANGGWSVNDVVINSSGKILLCGWAELDPDNDHEFLVLQLLSNGSLDPAFGNGGVMAFHPGQQNVDCEAFDMALQSDGRIVVATEGEADAPGFVPIWGFRLNTNGTLDTSFGENGLVINEAGGTAAWNVAIGPNDEVFLAGFGPILGALQDLVTMQFNADGTSAVDAYHECDPNESSLAQGAWFQADGKPIALGLTDGEAYIARWLPNGSLDPTFGNSGTVSETTIDIAPSGDDHTGELWVEDDGRLLVCGRSGAVPGNGDDAIIMAFYPGATGVSDRSPALELGIGPVPANDHVTITTPEQFLGRAAVIELFTTTGELVHSQSIGVLAKHTLIVLPPSLADGLYTINMRTSAADTQPARLIIQR